MAYFNRTALCLLALATACAGNVVAPGPAPSDTAPPMVQREMRGLWVATVGNIDWPSRSGLTADQQRKELVEILTKAAGAGFNTIVLQIRPAADALYQSSLEPWAAWLTGVQGSDPGYDPLAFAIAESHARGLQVHAWINPFRAGNTADTAKLAPTHVWNTQRDLVRVYGGNIWMDPGAPEAQERSLRVIADIVTRYDIDGIHADDYFYPYQVRDSSGKLLPFPDDSTYARYGAGVERDDWRRGNINAFIERMYREVHGIKPGVVVGLSPFGIWRPGFPERVRGLDAYATIYADSRKWLQQGWVDYFTPQLYWAIAAPQQSYPALLDWWIGENVQGRHIWPGLAAYRVQTGTASSLSLDEIPAQIRIDRQRPTPPGNILFNTKSVLTRNKGVIADILKKGLYATPAIVPAYRWLDSIPPEKPEIEVIENELHILAMMKAYTATELATDPSLTRPTQEPRWWLLDMHVPARWTWRGHKSSRWTSQLVSGRVDTIAIDKTIDHIFVQTLDQAGNASAPAEWRKPRE